MSRLYNKAVVMTDQHFGRAGGSQIANSDNLEFLAWAIDRAKSWGAEILISCGDWFDNRHSITVKTLDASRIGLNMINTGFQRSIIIPGNHDLPYRESRDIASITLAENLPNISVINNPVVIDDVLFLPWLVGDELKLEMNLKARYGFGHLEAPGFVMNNTMESGKTAYSVDPDGFENLELITTGHFHKRQLYKNVLYMGNIMPFDFNDADDDERGIILHEWGHDPIFEEWPDQPTFRYHDLSQLINEPDRFLKSKMTVKAKVDVDLKIEELQEVREALVAAYGLRKMELQHPKKAAPEGNLKEANVKVQTVDQIFVAGLQSLDTNEYSKDKLIAIYRDLPEVQLNT